MHPDSDLFQALFLTHIGQHKKQTERGTPKEKVFIWVESTAMGNMHPIVKYVHIQGGKQKQRFLKRKMRRTYNCFDIIILGYKDQ